MKECWFDNAKLERLKAAYKKAVENGKESFFFDGQEYLTTYAKYVIEYFKTKFKT